MANVLTLEELASYLRVHPSTVYRMLKKGQIPAFKVGSDWRFNVESIDHWRAAAEQGYAKRHNESARLRTEAVPPLIHASQFAREDSKKGLGLAQPVKRRWPPSRQSYYSSFEV